MAGSLAAPGGGTVPSGGSAGAAGQGGPSATGTGGSSGQPFGGSGCNVGHGGDLAAWSVVAIGLFMARRRRPGR